MLSSLQPLEEVPLMATLTDPDGSATGATWQWAWASSSRGSYTDIKDATEAAYTPKATDVGRWLRATASYDDGEGKYKSATGVSDNAVRAKIYVNTAPVFQDVEGEAITTTTRSVAEDAGPSVPVGDPVTATDIGENGSQEPLDYSLADGGDNDSFDIDVATGQIRVGAGTTLDFETKSSYMVKVTATDPEDAKDTIDVTITVTNVEERPTITGGAFTANYAENTETRVGIYSATDDEDDDDMPEKELTWSLSGADADDFCIDPIDPDPDDTGMGVLTFKNSPDYEAPTDTGGNNRYEVTVIATDSEGATTSRAVTVRVTNVDEDGEVTLSTLQPQVGINLTATLTDRDGRISRTTWQWARSTTVGGSYENITGATSATYTPHPSDVTYFLRATASYTDGHGGSKTAMEPSAKAVQIRAIGNVAPVFPDQDPNTPGVQNTATTINVREDVVPPNSVDGPVSATDTDDVLTYSLGGTDEASFTIDREMGQIKVAEGTKLDYETRPTYTVTVTATDPSLEAASITVTITVTNVNEAPELSRIPLAITGRTSVDYQEKGRNTVAVYTASGPEAASVRWSLSGVDAGDFSISGGRLTFRSAPNYEGPADQGTDNVYNVTVRAISGTHTATQDVTVRVDNVDEDGTVTLSPSQAVVRIQLTASLTDPDGGSGDTPPITATETDLTHDAGWQWSRSPNGSTGWTNIAGATSRTYIPVASDLGSYLRVTARYTDAQGSGKGATSAPVEVFAVLSNGVVTLSPSQPDIGIDVTALLTDPDGGVTGLTWQWARSLDGSTGWTDIPGAASATYRPVQADAGTYLRATASYTDAQASGQRANAVSLQVPGSQPVVAVSLSSSEAEVGVGLTASLTGPAGVITGLSWQWSRSENGITGWTEIADGTAASYTPVEADLRKYLRATARYNDAQGFGQRVRSAVVLVIRVGGNGVVTLSSTRPEVGVGLTATLTDPDDGVTGLMWQWARSPNRSTGWTDIASATSATYTPGSGDEGYYLRVTANYNDAQASGQSAQAIPNNVVNIAPAFPATETGVRSVAENTAAGQNVGAPVMATDSPSDTLTYTLGGDDAESFDVAASTGQLMTKAPLDYETKSLHRVNVTATDRFGASDTIMVIITVIDVNEHPSVVTGDTVVDYSEDSSEAVSTYAATDAEDDPADLAWSVLGADMAAFDISATGELTFKEPPDFEAPTDADADNVYEVTVAVTDSGSNTATRDVTVTVINVREDGVVTLSSQPEVGVELTASLNDPDGGVTGLAWQWARSADGSTGWTNISGATSANYTPVDADANMFLRATASYTDAHASGQTANAVTGSATELDVIRRYDANGNGIIERDEAIAAVRDYFDRLITRDQVIMVIQSYFASAGQSGS